MLENIGDSLLELFVMLFLLAAFVGSVFVAFKYGNGIIEKSGNNSFATFLVWVLGIAFVGLVIYLTGAMFPGYEFE